MDFAAISKKIIMPNNNEDGDTKCANSNLGLFQSQESVSSVDYSFEKERIDSFVSWPVHFPVDPLRLAKAGFYYTGNEDEVICFSCQGHVKNWNYGDIVLKKHTSLFPDCDFINSRSNNVPITQTKKSFCDFKQKNLAPKNINLSDIIKTINYNQMKSSDERLKTFEKSWPHQNIDVLKLSQAGFFYLGYEDKVQCPFCKGIVSNWEAEDDPLGEHRKHFPWCNYLPKDLKNPKSEKSSWFKTNSEDICGNMNKHILNEASAKYKLLNKDQEHVNLKKLGVHLYNSPAHPQQASLSARLRSFINWPATSPLSKEDLAKAGFFYIGIGDHTKCFHCNGGLCNWETGDDPWVEHAKWFCNCNFLRLSKGEEFVEDCLKENIPRNIKEQIPSHTSTQFSSEPLMIKVDEAMKSDMVKYVLDSGLFPHYIVRVAILRQIEETGSNFSSMNDFCSAVNYLKEEIEKMPLKRESCDGLDIGNIDMRKCVIDESKSIDNIKDAAEIQQDTSFENLAASCLPNENNLQAKKADKTDLSEDHRLCKICMDKEVGIVFLPCGHLLACTECAPAMELCPMCRKPIHATIRAYLP